MGEFRNNAPVSNQAANQNVGGSVNYYYGPVYVLPGNVDHDALLGIRNQTAPVVKPTQGSLKSPEPSRSPHSDATGSNTISSEYKVQAAASRTPIVIDAETPHRSATTADSKLGCNS